jgi:hypothetical protein
MLTFIIIVTSTSDPRFSNHGYAMLGCLRETHYLECPPHQSGPHHFHLLHPPVILRCASEYPADQVPEQV